MFEKINPLGLFISLSLPCPYPKEGMKPSPALPNTACAVPFYKYAFVCLKVSQSPLKSSCNLPPPLKGHCWRCLLETNVIFPFGFKLWRRKINRYSWMELSGELIPLLWNYGQNLICVSECILLSYLSMDGLCPSLLLCALMYRNYSKSLLANIWPCPQPWIILLANKNPWLSEQFGESLNVSEKL